MKRKSLFALCVSIPLLGSVALAEGPGGSHHKRQGGKMFLEADTNSDGTLSKEEFLAFHSRKAEQRFSKLDQDGDGSVTKEEAKNARKEWRKKMKERRREWRERNEQSAE